ncbi:hypothetical protein MMC17_002388 [Xylographa soralifera]|nr:hypothetical protein [Xylographa soralifera]
MKRKLGFGLAPIKVPTSKNIEVSEPPSPEYSHATLPLDRQILSPQVLSDLRLSCAKILHEVGPSGAEYDEILNQRDPLEKYHSDRKALTDLRTQSHKTEHPASRTRQRSDSAPYSHMPTNAARDFKATVSGRTRDHSRDNRGPYFEPLEPTHTTISGSSGDRKLAPNDPLSHIRANLDTRPKTSAAACIDYNGPSAGTSSSTSRTATTYDPVRPSTGITSQAMTPANEKRTSQRTSEPLSQDKPASSAADATAKAWMSQELARRRAAQDSRIPSIQPSRGTSIRSKQPSSTSEFERPPSRADSIRSGIKGYIRPRASSDSVRSGRSENYSRPLSRDRDSSKPTHHSWWRGASAGLRRKGSWSSFRSARTDEDNFNNSEASAGQNRGLDLNRSLPPLPGLDQYVEKKEARLHISQLMARRNAPPNSSDLSQRPPASTQNSTVGLSINTGGVTVVDYKGLTRTLSVKETQSRDQDLKRLVQEKMLRGALSPTGSSGGGSVGRVGSSASNREHDTEVRNPRQSVGAMRDEKVATVRIIEVEKPQIGVQSSPSVKKKGGFMSRWARLLGGEKKLAPST